MRNMGERSLRSVTLNLFLALTDNIFEFFLNAFMSSCEFTESQFVVSSLIKSILNFFSQVFSGISKTFL